METKVVSTRLPEEISQRIESYAKLKNLKISSVLSELICEHFNLEYTPEEFAIFTKVSKALLLLSSTANQLNAYYSEIGKELISNLTVNPGGDYKRTDSGMYYFDDTEKLRDLITECLEVVND